MLHSQRHEFDRQGHSLAVFAAEAVCRPLSAPPLVPRSQLQCAIGKKVLENACLKAVEYVAGKWTSPTSGSWSWRARIFIAPCEAPSASPPLNFAIGLHVLDCIKTAVQARINHEVLVLSNNRSSASQIESFQESR